MKRRLLLDVFVVLLLVNGILVLSAYNPNNRIPELVSEPNDERTIVTPVANSLVSDHIYFDGTLDPALIEQTVKKTTAILHAETDSKTNVKTNLSIDTTNDWTGSRASVDLWNLNRLYIENEFQT